MAGTSPAMTSEQFKFQTATRDRPVFLSGDGCACLSFAPDKIRGSGAPSGAPTNTPRMKLTLLREPDAFGVDIPTQSSLRRLRRLICVDAAPVGAPLRRFWASEPYFRGLDRASSPMIRRLSPPSSVPRPAIEGS